MVRIYCAEIVDEPGNAVFASGSETMRWERECPFRLISVAYWKGRMSPWLLLVLEVRVRVTTIMACVSGDGRGGRHSRLSLALPRHSVEEPHAQGREQPILTRIRVGQLPLRP
jgi:hypothetical protein